MRFAPSIATVLFATLSLAAHAASAQVLRFSPAVLDLGEMAVGTPKTATLTVTNASDAPITIESVKAGCGCTKVSDAPKGPVAAGGSFTLQVTLDPGAKPGVELVKSLSMVLAGGTVETMQIKARVKDAAPGEKPAELVVLFRLPPAASEDPRRAEIERTQDSLIREIDAGMADAGTSEGFRMRLHRETGMLFVHGTPEDLAATREAVRALPASSAVRESGEAPPA